MAVCFCAIYPAAGHMIRIYIHIKQKLDIAGTGEKKKVIPLEGECKLEQDELARP